MSAINDGHLHQTFSIFSKPRVETERGIRRPTEAQPNDDLSLLPFLVSRNQVTGAGGFVTPVPLWQTVRTRFRADSCGAELPKQQHEGYVMCSGTRHLGRAWTSPGVTVAQDGCNSTTLQSCVTASAVSVFSFIGCMCIQ